MEDDGLTMSDKALGTEELDEGQVRRALQAFVRAEFQAPVAAIAGFVDLLIEDAARAGLEPYRDDLNRIRAASQRLTALIAELVEDRSSRWTGVAAQDLSLRNSVRDALRHDLRTPITSIIGYGELVAEEAREKGSHELLQPLADVFDAARLVLSDIDRLIDYAERPLTSAPDASVITGPTILQQAIEAIRHLAEGRHTVRSEVVGHILVVDDNKSILDLITRRLTREGHDVVTCANGEAALGVAARQHFDLVLLDLMMPGMSGLEVLRRLKEAPGTAGLPVIMISALDELEAVVRCIDAGAEDYLSKPLDATLLRARIGSSLERKFLRDREQATLRQLHLEQECSDKLLRNVLPDVIVERLRRGEMVTADHFDSATILFCDLVGFTALTSQLPPGETLGLLNEVFSGFDRLAADHGLEKIKTIGDAYMVAGGLPEPRPDHALAAAAMALAMTKVVADVSSRRRFPLNVRIGIDTGPAIAGIIGSQKFFYDVWGDTVNLASRLESLSEPGRIHISQTVRDALGSAFQCECRGVIEVKGKGALRTFFLERPAQGRNV